MLTFPASPDSRVQSWKLINEDGMRRESIDVKESLSNFVGTTYVASFRFEGMDERDIRYRPRKKYFS